MTTMRALFAAVSIGLVPISATAAASGPPPGFASLRELTTAIRLDIRYAGAENFMGRPVPGYGASECWLRREVAEALLGVATDLARSSWRLVVHDCYRPERAVGAFVAWAADPKDQLRKQDYYPAIDKSRLFALGYIARASSHSRGTAVDASAESIDPSGHVTALDFGTPFDRFDKRSATASPAVSLEAAGNRRRLVAAFSAHGFSNYPREWWHFGFKGKGVPTPSFDVPIEPAGPEARNRP